MLDDPGISSPDAATDSQIDNPKLNLPTWARQGRWAARYGEGKKPSPFTPAIARAVEGKRKGITCGKTHGKPEHAIDLARCVTGDDLLRASANQQLWPCPLNPRAATPPREDLQHRAGGKWRLRGSYLELLGWLAAAIVGLHGSAVRATHAELAELLDLCPRRVGDVIFALRTWGLVHATPSYVAQGKVTSQRASVYRLTRVFFWTFGLVPPAGHTAPEPEPTPEPRIARARQVGTKVPTNPDTEQIQYSDLREIKYSSRADGPTTAVSPPPAATGVPDLAAVPTGSTAAPQPATCVQSCNPGQRLCEPRGANTAGGHAGSGPDAKLGEWRMPELIGHIREGGKIYERRRPHAEAPRDERPGAARYERHFRDEEIIAERELDRVTGNGPRDLAPAELAASNAPPPPAPRLDDLLEHARRERERLERERSARAPIAAPARPALGDDYLEVIERAVRSHGRGKDLTPAQFAALQTLRRGEKPRGES